MWAGRFYSRGECTIFPRIEAENAIFPFRSRAGMRHFRPGVRKNFECACVCDCEFGNLEVRIFFFFFFFFLYK